MFRPILPPKVIYVAYIPITFTKHDEQVKVICILTFHKRYNHFGIKESHCDEKRQKSVSRDLNCAIGTEVAMEQG